MKDHITLKMAFGLEISVKTIKVKYFIVYFSSPYNVIIGTPSLHLLWFDISTLHLSMKYLLPNEWVRVVRGTKKSPINVIKKNGNNKGGDSRNHHSTTRRVENRCYKFGSQIGGGEWNSHSHKGLKGSLNWTLGLPIHQVR